MSIIAKLFGVIVITFSFLITSCASTKPTSTWVDSTYKGGYLNSIMVVGVSDNIKYRKMFEDEFVRQFKSHGVEAVSSAAVISPGKKLDTDTLKGEAEKLGIEVIFVTHVLGIEDETVRYPVAFYGTRYGPNLGTYYPAIMGRVNRTEYEFKYKQVKLESKLFEVETEEMIWSASSEIIDPGSIKPVLESFSKRIMKNLSENNLLRR